MLFNLSCYGFQALGLGQHAFLSWRPEGNFNYLEAVYQQIKDWQRLTNTGVIKFASSIEQQTCDNLSLFE